MNSYTGHVKEKKFIIVGGGPSVLDYPVHEVLHKAKQDGFYSIGINEAGLLCRTDAILTMDRVWMEKRRQACIDRGVDTFLRHTVYDRKYPWKWNKLYRVPMFHELGDYQEHIRKNDHKLDYALFGNNSGLCGFNFALNHNPEYIFLFGLDLQGDAKKVRFYKNYEWDEGRATGNHYRKWAPDFDRMLSIVNELGIKVYNCSNRSLIKEFPTLTPKAVEKVFKV